jgi:hypothetical protein
MPGIPTGSLFFRSVMANSEAGGTAGLAIHMRYQNLMTGTIDERTKCGHHWALLVPGPAERTG